ncbi:DUF2812 domain-containing protein [Nocardiopsis sp. JB363]|uniref:DUF2812 domain-containing protein n=1 Tax=Nocardiopsis sp. JB363 TaxID=1434837 RepID=UPI00097A1878|nr:DUF2812 domain-containing protein [Nocardiopsis sp. JB363]SIO88244.1 hypothetical protein BQ8420_18550 [Nocardiopsis sp. JB363]
MNYLDELATLLRERGVSEDRIRSTTDDLSAFLAEGDLDPEEEFGPPTEFADDLVGEEGPEPAPESLVWAADSFAATERLNELGAQGWEVDRVDRFGRFVSHRGEQPQIWEYRQEIAPGRRERERSLGRLAPEGWEPAGHYFTFAYFKRARAALVGPAAELAERPEPTRKRFFWSPAGLLTIGIALVVLVISLYSLGGTLWEGDNADRVATMAGAGVGALIGVGAVLGVFWLVARVRNR